MSSAKLEMIVKSFAKDISVTFELSVSLMSHRNKLGLKIGDIYRPGVFYPFISVINIILIAANNQSAYSRVNAGLLGTTVRPS